ncbi:hypothetical protein AB0I68_38540 [Streptomyces sp. NPDC050448]
MTQLAAVIAVGGVAEYRVMLGGALSPGFWWVVAAAPTRSTR